MVVPFPFFLSVEQAIDPITRKDGFMENKIDLSLLSNLDVTGVNVLPSNAYFEYDLTGKDGKEINSKICLDGIWNLLYDQKGFNFEAFKFTSVDSNISLLPRIKVPGVVERQGFGYPHYVNQMYPWDGRENISIGQMPKDENPFEGYFKDFNVTKEFLSRKNILVFNGVFSSYYVYINGKFIGYSARYFSQSKFDVSDFLQEGKNRISVFVFKYASGSWLHDQDMWRLSGIFRSVEIQSLSSTYLDNINILSDFDFQTNNGLLKIKIKIGGELKGSLRLKLAKEKNILLDKDIKIENEELFIKETFNNVLPWSAEIPNLYKLSIIIFNKDGTNQKIQINVGFRNIQIEDGILKINGKRVVMHGFNRQEFDMKTGWAVSKDVSLFDIKFFKDHNVNTVRCSHYPNDPYFYDLCDKYGIYVIDEADFETHGTWQEARGVRVWNKLNENETPAINPKWKKMIMDRQINLVARDINHPSVIIWSIGNECSAGENTKEAYELIHKLDSSRPVHYESCFDVEGHKKDSDFYSRMYGKPKEMKEFLMSDDIRPAMECEFEHSMGVSDGNFDKYINLEETYDRYAGGCIWDYIDQGFLKKDTNGKTYIACGGDFFDKPNDGNFNCNGVLNADRSLAYNGSKSMAIMNIYQPIKFEINTIRDEVKIINKYSFLNSNIFSFIIEVLDDGKIVYKNPRVFKVDPLSSGVFSLGVSQVKTKGEKIIRVSAKVKDNIYGLTKNRILAYKEVVVNGSTFDVSDTKTAVTNISGKVEYIKGTFNDGLKNGQLSLIDGNYLTSGLVSLRVANAEFIYDRILPTFWRAGIDNDNGNGFNNKSSSWFAASKFSVSTVKDQVILENKDGSYSISNTYSFPAVPGVSLAVNYSMLTNETIRVDVKYKGTKGAPSLPLIGLRIPLTFLAEYYTYYGLGPCDTYFDRLIGGKFGIYNLSTHIAGEDGIGTHNNSYNIPSNPYVQDIGNKSGVRWLEIKHPLGKKIRFEAIDKALYIRVINHSEFELQSASHWNELGRGVRTYVNIIGFERGIGGDDSWGAPVYPEYVLSGEKDYEYSFLIKGLAQNEKKHK